MAKKSGVDRIESFIAGGGVEVCPFAKLAAQKGELIFVNINDSANPQKSLEAPVSRFLEQKDQLPSQSLILFPSQETPQNHSQSRDLARKYFVELLVAFKKIESPHLSEQQIRAELALLLVNWEDPIKRNEIDFKGKILDLIGLSPFYKNSSLPTRYAPRFFLSGVWSDTVFGVKKKTRRSIQRQMKKLCGEIYDARELYIIPKENKK